MKVGILGSGFGLYGYMPALVNLGLEVSVPMRYAEKIAKREELRKNLTDVFFKSEDQILSDCEILVIAKRPEDQFDLLNKLSNSKHKFLLEKPLAKNSADQRQLINLLRDTSRKFSIAYLFEFIVWYQTIESKSESGEKLEIEISWNVGPSKDNWKNIDKKGGGLLKYYGCHILYVFYKLNILDPNIIFDGTRLVLQGKNNSNIGINTNIFSGSNTEFKVYANQNLIFCAQTPFGKAGKIGALDERIKYLMEYIKLNLESDFSQRSAYLKFEEYLSILIEEFE
jgi:Oxidoreductase family, NAD-binding Rossmann fold